MDKETIKEIVSAVQKPPIILEISDEARVALAAPGTQVLDLSKFLPPPKRIRQRIELLTTTAFIDYVNTYKETGETAVFANEPAASYEAVIDYHHTVVKERAWQEHVAKYTCPRSPQWMAWVGSSGKLFGQIDFAQFLERNLTDITSPAGAAFLQLALSLQMHKSAEFESEYKLENGQVRFRYQETIKQQSKAGDIDIPQVFKITIPVFIDGARFEMQCRFRYKVGDGGALSLGYEVIRHDEVYTAAIKEVSKEISEGITGDVKFYVGHRG